MGYWKSKVVPKIKKIFEKNGKKAAAAEASKSFDESKDEYNKLFEEKKSELQPKVVEIYEASSTEVKTLLKEPQDAGLKKHSAAVQKFLDELVKIEFPGSKAVHEASSKFGPALVSGPVFFVFEKVSTFIITEEKKEGEAPASAAAAEGETAGREKAKEIVVEEEKKDAAAEKSTTESAAEADPDPTAAATTASTEPPKVEETAPAVEQPKP